MSYNEQIQSLFPEDRGLETIENISIQNSLVLQKKYPSLFKKQGIRN